MKRLLAAVALVLVGIGLSQPAQADGRRHDGWNDGWRHDGWRHNGWRNDDWRWDRPHRYARPPRQVIMVYPPPVVYARPNPRVVVMDPGPVQAVPTSPPYTDGYGRYCREYQSTLSVDGTAQSGYGTACLQPDGSWRIVN